MMAARRYPRLVGVLVIIGILAAVPLTMPWAFHIGGRWTPLLTWFGSGTLVANGGKQYPIYVQFHPSRGGSGLRLDGKRSSSGIGGSGCLCTAPGAVQVLDLSGNIYGAWRSTDDSLLELRVSELVVSVGTPKHGFFDLFGRWDGQELVMDDRGEWSAPFRSGLRIQHASVRLHWNPVWTCKNLCSGSREQ